MRTTDDEVTDPDEYLQNNPKFAKCRVGRHRFPDEDEVDLVEAYNDAEATHQKLFTCPVCKVKVRRRFVVVIRRRKIVSYTELDPRSDYREAKGYLAKGTRITPRYAREFGIRRQLEATLDSSSSANGSAPRRVRAASARTKTPGGAARKEPAA